MGTHSVSASYSGDPAVTPGNTGPATVIVARAGSQAGAVISSAPQIFHGQDVILTATFSASAFGDIPMTGTVSFFDGETLLGTVPLVASGMTGNHSAASFFGAEAPPTVSGQASPPTSSLNVGDHVIRAVYSRDVHYSPATSATSASVRVVPMTTSTSLAAATTPQGTTLTANVVVTSPGDPTVSGAVSFHEGTTLLGTATVVDGVATLVIGALPPGGHTLTAAYPRPM